MVAKLYHLTCPKYRTRMFAPRDQPTAYKLAFGYREPTCATTSRMSPKNEAE